MKFTKQELINNLVHTLNGKGRATKLRPDMDEEVCCYIPENPHPGCAIGCQPGFREAFADCDPDGSFSRVGLLERQFPEQFKHVFGEVGHDDINFLTELQDLHDDFYSWSGNGLKLKKSVVEEFCGIRGLCVPESDYA